MHIFLYSLSCYSLDILLILFMEFIQLTFIQSKIIVLITACITLLLLRLPKLPSPFNSIGWAAWVIWATIKKSSHNLQSYVIICYIICLYDDKCYVTQAQNYAYDSTNSLSVCYIIVIQVLTLKVLITTVDALAHFETG